jgi:hypothetical protein
VNEIEAAHDGKLNNSQIGQSAGHPKIEFVGSSPSTMHGRLNQTCTIKARNNLDQSALLGKQDIQ